MRAWRRVPEPFTGETLTAYANVLPLDIIVSLLHVIGGFFDSILKSRLSSLQLVANLRLEKEPSPVSHLYTITASVFRYAASDSPRL